MLYCITDERKSELIDSIKFIEKELDMLALVGTVWGNTIVIENGNTTNHTSNLERKILCFAYSRQTLFLINKLKAER